MLFIKQQGNIFFYLVLGNILVVCNNYIEAHVKYFDGI